MPTIHDKLLRLSATIRELEKKYQRPPHSVSLLAVTKGQPLEKIQEALATGQHHFGENYLQEALSKMDQLQDPALEWHFIGSIQSNKTRQIAERFAWVHTVCNKKIAQRLNDQRPKDLPPLNICLELNLGKESTKAGITEVEEVQALASYCQTLPSLSLRGLMTVPAPKPNLEEQRAEFKKVAEIQERLRQQGIELDSLSMGMTDDLEAAIAEGATIVRVGRGIFGERTLYL